MAIKVFWITDAIVDSVFDTGTEGFFVHAVSEDYEERHRTEKDRIASMDGVTA